MIKFLKSLWIPDAFRSDPKSFCVNQVGHAALGAVSFYLLGQWGLVLYAYWEMLQLSLNDAEPSDSFEDFGFFLIGWMIPLWYWTGAVGLIFLIAGSIQRTPK